jgi:hypothetical protein
MAISASRGARSSLQSLVKFLAGPPRHPVRQLVQWYVLIGGLGTLLVMNVPLVRASVLAGPITESLGRDPFGLPTGAELGTFAGEVQMVVVMMGTLLLSIPVSWGYMAIREKDGFDQSVVQTIVILPVVVAAIMMIVQHSLALAFALAGVTAAVRFRNTLKDVADATYVFLSLGIGIAAGVGTLAGAAIMSCNFGCPYEAGVEAPTGALNVVGSGNGSGGSSIRDGVLSVQIIDAEAERTAIEGALALFAKRWEFDRLEPEDEGGALVRYHVRLRKSARPDTIVHEILTRGGEAVADARFEPLAV